jgi:hypothetical protein
MIVYSLSEPLRRRFADVARVMGMRTDMPIAEMGAFLAGVLSRGLAVEQREDRA